MSEFVKLTEFVRDAGDRKVTVEVLAKAQRVEYGDRDAVAFTYRAVSDFGFDVVAQDPGELENKIDSAIQSRVSGPWTPWLWVTLDLEIFQTKDNASVRPLFHWRECQVAEGPGGTFHRESEGAHVWSGHPCDPKYAEGSDLVTVMLPDTAEARKQVSDLLKALSGAAKLAARVAVRGFAAIPGARVAYAEQGPLSRIKEMV